MTNALKELTDIVGERKVQQVLDIVSPARLHRHHDRLLELAGFMGNHTFMDIVEAFDLAQQILFNQPQE